MALKSDHINDAYSQLRISGITVNPTPANQQLALTRMENMLAQFDFDVGYNFEETPDMNTESGVGRKHHHMIATNLAVRLIPDFNKQVPDTLMRQSMGAYSASVSAVAAENIKQVQPSSRMPRGSGNHRRYTPSNRYNTEPEVIKDAIPLTVGDVEDYTESYSAYLDGETISSFTITVTSELTLNSSSNTDDVVSYRITAATDGTGSVTIVITTSSGRKTTRIKYFEVS